VRLIDNEHVFISIDTDRSSVEDNAIDFGEDFSESDEDDQSATDSESESKSHKKTVSKEKKDGKIVKQNNKAKKESDDEEKEDQANDDDDDEDDDEMDEDDLFEEVIGNPQRLYIFHSFSNNREDHMVQNVILIKKN
jgi:hypothetical protein